MSEVYVGISLSDGSVAHLAFQTEMRAPVHPGGPWVGPTERGIFVREATDENIEYEVGRASRLWHLDGKATVSWRRLTQEEHEKFGRDRDYRNALEDVGGVLKYNMPKARELHRAVLRHYAGDRLLTLDRDWVDAMAKGNKPGADVIERSRKVLRDAANDPRIETAQTLEELKALVPAIVGS